MVVYSSLPQVSTDVQPLHKSLSVTDDSLFIDDNVDAFFLDNVAGDLLGSISSETIGDISQCTNSLLVDDGQRDQATFEATVDDLN